MSGPIVPPLTVSDVADGGSVTGRPITTIEVTDGTLTVSGRTATITTGGGGGSGTVTSITAAADSGTGTAITTSGTFTFTGGTGVTTSVSGTTVTVNADNNGDVTATGTPVDNQLAVWDSATSIEGDANLTWDGSTLSVTGALDIDNIKIDGNTISSTDTDGAIDLSPNGAGVVTMYNAYRFPTAVTSSNDYALVAQTDGTTAWAEVSAGAIEGTAVLSTGETGATKYLREDGDNTCSWQTVTASVPDPLRLSAGSAAAPTYSFSGDTDTGIYLDGTNGISFSGGGARQMNILPNGVMTLGTGAAAATISSSSTQNLVLQTNAGTNSGTITITDGVDGDISLTPNGAGAVEVSGVYKLPTAVTASNDYALVAQTDGTTAWAAVTASVPDPLLLSNGDATDPTYSFSGDTDTGIYLGASNQLAFTTEGSQRLVISASGLQSIPLGSVGTPSISFYADNNTGIYSGGANEMAFVSNGNISARITNSLNGLYVGDGDNAAYITSEGAQNLILETNAGSSSGTITIQDAANQDILIEPDGTGLVTFYTGANAWTIENSQGAANQVLTTDGAGAATWEDAGGGTAGAAQIIGVPYGFNGGTDYFLLNRSPFGTIKTAAKSWSQSGCQCYPFIARNSAVIDTATLYVSATGGTTTGTLDFAIYSDNAGVPNAKLGECSFDPTTASQQTETVDSSVTTVAGTQYWAVLVKNGTDANPSIYANNLTYENALGIHGNTFGEGNPVLRSSSDTTLPASFTSTNLAASDLPRYALGVKYV